uniref:Uncharacterized protein n=1 Tax=Strongyloides venezuelensis TaxID=75913 RepID=A0A0K0F4F1_STRVS
MSSSCSLDAINYAKIVDMECYKFLNNHIHTDKEVEDLYKLVINILNELKNLKTESGKLLFNIEFFIGDNVMMHHMLEKKLSFSYRSKDSCISCTLDGNQLKKHIKAFSTRKFIRNFVENNFLVHDTFHDLHEDVVSYMLFLSINLFMHRFEKNSSYVKKEIMIQAGELKLHLQLASVLKDEFFTKKQGKKGDFNTKGIFPLKEAHQVYTMFHNITHYGLILKTFENISPTYFSTIRFEGAKKRVKDYLLTENSSINRCKTVLQKMS